ncbi:MAG: Bax inhibitor-1/YccA family protein [Bacilli bacterium]|nr:Bax inhibitor-1/YccA family protein [Bacilli bacterium]
MDNNSLYAKMFGWLFMGLLVTFATGYCLSLNQELMVQVLTIGIIPIIIIEIVIAVFLGMRIAKMNPITTKVLYIIFSVITGITFSAIFVAYKVSSIIYIFLLTSLIFGILAFYGFITKKDLTKLGAILFVSLIVMIIASLLNVFLLKSSSLDLGLTILGILVFTLYIAYDVNRVKLLMDAVGEEKAAVYGAFQLYLDFINLFIRLLELFGKRND